VKNNDRCWKWVLLMEATIREMDVIESLLRSYQIPVMKKDRGAFGFLRAASPLPESPVALYVPDYLYERAKTVIQKEDRQ